MAIDTVAGDVEVYTVDEIAALYKRDYLNANPDADVGDKTLVDIDARTFAAQEIVNQNNAVLIGRGRLLTGKTGADLEAAGAAEGVERPQASGSQGFVTIDAASGGTTIIAGDEIVDYATRTIRFICGKTALYLANDEVPIVSVDTGAAVNLPAGTKMRWTNPRPGCVEDATVYQNTDGTGLTGGRAAATDEEYIAEIIRVRANPPAGGNDAEYQKAIRKTPGLQIQSAFTYPALAGPGTTGFAFLLKPEKRGGSRIPNNAQIALVEENLRALEPGDDGPFGLIILEQPEEVALRVDWSAAGSEWTDFAPWPAFIPGDQVRVAASPTPTATSFRLVTATTTANPVVGQTIGLYDLGDQAFARKRILSATPVIAGKSWDIVVDQTAAAQSDLAFIPTAGALVSPWSDGLDGLVPSVLDAFDKLGVGENVTTFYDEGTRQRRSPAASPKEYPNELSNRLLVDPIFSLPEVDNASLLIPETEPLGTDPGVLTVSVYLITLADLAFYAPE